VSVVRNLVRDVVPRRDSFSGEVLQSFLTNIGLNGLTVLTGIMLARLLGPEKRGELAAIQAMPMIVASFGQLGLNEAVVYFGGRNREQAGRFAVSAASLILLAGIPIVLASALLVPWVLREQDPAIVFASQIFMALLFVNAIDGTAISTVRAHHRIPLWNALRSGPRVLWLLVVAAFFALGTTEPVRIALVYLALYFGLSLAMIYAVRGYLRGQWLPQASLWPRLLRFGLPVAAGVAPRLLNQRIDQLIIAAILPPRELGLYAVAVAWTGLGQLPAATIQAVSFSKISGMRELEVQLRFIRGAVGAVAVSTLAVAAALAVATPLAIRWAFGPDFRDATPLAWILLLAVVLRSVAWMLQIGMQGIGQPTVGMYSQWSGLVLLVPTALALLPRFGAVGAAWALVVAAGASLLVASLLSCRAVRRARLAEAGSRDRTGG
jgi:O-antigen/teichoic acid export membrane protein